MRAIKQVSLACVLVDMFSLVPKTLDSGHALGQVISFCASALPGIPDCAVGAGLGWCGGYGQLWMQPAPRWCCQLLPRILVPSCLACTIYILVACTTGCLSVVVQQQAV